MKSPLFVCFTPVVIATAALLVSGCLSTDEFEFAIDSISRQPLPAGQAASFRIQNCNPAIKEDRLRFQEAAGYIKTALSGRGLWEAPSPASAALIVELDYGIAPPKMVHREIDVPIFGEVGNVSGQNVTIRPRSGGMGDADRGLPDDDGQVVGYTTRTEPIVVFEKHLLVTCRENKRATVSEPPVTLWRVCATLEDPNKDLRDSLPVLAAMVMKKIGQATDGVTMESLKSNDASIKFVRRGLD